MRWAPRPLFLWLLVGGAALVTAAGFLGGLWWRLDLLAHFRVQYVVAFVLLAGLAAALRTPRPAAAALVLAVVNAALVAPAWFGRDADPGTPRLRVLVANVHTSNPDHASLLRLLDEVDPDVIALVEVDEAWVASLAAVAARYPHTVLAPRADNFGLAVLSRVAVADAVVADRTTSTPWLHARVGDVHLALVHPIPPVTAAASAERDATLATIARAARAFGPRALVCGDFNATPWSHAFRAFARASALRDTRAGFGLHATWPAGLWPARIPIDHCFAGDGLAVVARRVLRDIGSDHLPVLIEVAVR